ncbi:MAG: omptin family outer membrane protease [Thermodesulfobacteriota bacterium]
MEKLIKKSFLAALATLAMMFSATDGRAEDPFGAREQTVHERGNVRVTARVQGGYLTGEANEFVYWPQKGGHTASQLIWQIDDIYMVGTGISVSPISWLTISGDIFVNVADGGGTMDDYDWLLPGYDWTDWSHHENVDVTQGFIWDFSTEMTPFPHSPVKLIGIIGYRADSWEWEARGGTYVYSQDSFRDTEGSFPANDLGITYEQNFYVPYLGLGLVADLGPLVIKARVMGSTIAWGEANDFHHMRGLETKDEFEMESWIGVDVSGEFRFGPNLGLRASFNYSDYDTMKGDAEWNYLYENKYLYLDDGAGADLSTTMFALSFLVNF